MNKKALMWETIIKWLILLTLLIVLLIVLWLFRGKVAELWGNIANMLRFGGR